MPNLDPSAVADKWATRLTSASSEITAGVNGVTVAPGVAAAAHADLWLQRITASKTKWMNNVKAVTLDEWKRKMLDVGIGRISGGATANKPKMVAFFSEFLPFVHSNAAKVRSMPKGDLGASVARATKMIQLNAQFKRGAGPNQSAS